MLIGEYRHTVDQKNRISLPAKFRKELGKQVVVTRGLDNCLFLYSAEGWKAIAEKLGDMSLGQGGSRGFARFVFGSAHEVEIDSAGRILIPDSLKAFAGIGERAVFAGVHTRVELWSEDAWKQYSAQIEKQADQLAEKLGEIGAI